MLKLLLVIKREFLTKVKSKAYLVLIFLSPILMLGMFAAIFYFVDKDKGEEVEEQPKVLVVGSSDYQKLLEQDFEAIVFENVASLPFKQTKSLFTEGVYDGVISIDKTKSSYKVMGLKSLPLKQFKNVLEKRIKLELVQAENLGEVAKKIVKTDFVELIATDNDTTIKKWVKGIVAVGAGYLIMMFVIIYGNSVMRSIIEEKNSRVIEVLICSVKPFQLMLGKIIGNALAGLLQFFIWGLLLFLGLFLMQSMFGVNTEQTNLLTKVFEIIWEINYTELLIGFVFFFLSGYLLYSGFYTAVGAAVNSETDTQQFVHPILLPLMFAVYIGVATVVNGNPNGDTAFLFSMIPLTSPIVMTMRIPYGVPFWEISVSLALLLVSFVTTVYIASKIYRIGILTYGNKPSIKQLVSWMFRKQ